MRTRTLALCLVVLVASSCKEKKEAPGASQAVATSASKPDETGKVRKEHLAYNELSRIDFNARAQELFLPLFWRADANLDETI